MSSNSLTLSQTLLLGAIAGSTIFLGLPIGRIKGLDLRARGILSALSAGVLLFIFWDVMTHATDSVEGALLIGKAGGGWSLLVERAALLIVGFAAGSVGLAIVEASVLRRKRPLPVAGGAPATAHAIEAAELADRVRSQALRFGMLIAVAIGLHNFSEGLAIGVSARTGEVALAGTLIVGFALHNATEGFGIVGPLGAVRPSWGWLGIAGLVAGGPTFIGTLVGWHASSPAMELLFFALAGGAILYVVGQIWVHTARTISSRLVLSGIVAGYLLGLASDLIIAYAGG